MQTIALSESAVAVLRFRVKGWRFPIRDRDHDAFQELVLAGIMLPDGDDYGKKDRHCNASRFPVGGAGTHP